nr:hypothetical protein [Tanacetum cinerariifolium]
MLKNLKAKFKWVTRTVEKLKIPLPHQLTETKLTPIKKKRKRIMEVARNAFLKADVRVNRIERKLVPPMGVTTDKYGQVIKHLEPGILFFNGNTNLGFQRINKFDLATIVQLLRMHSFIIQDSDYARTVVVELILLIESRPDCVKGVLNEVFHNVRVNLWDCSNERLKPRCPVRKAWMGWGLSLRMVNSELQSLSSKCEQVGLDSTKEGPTNFALMAYFSTSSNSEIVDKCKIGLGYNDVPPPYTGNFMPPKPDLSFSSLEEFVNEPIVSKPTVKKSVIKTSKAKASADKPKAVKKNFGPPLIED